MRLRFEIFKTDHFTEYRSWYEDSDLNKTLGPLDQEWLDCVLKQENGCQYSVFDESELVAVVGIDFPDSKHPIYFISDIAVKPSLRERGIGSQTIDDLIEMHKLKPGQSWVASVDEKNPRAKSFFEKKGWVAKSETPNQHGMLELRFSKQETKRP